MKGIKHDKDKLEWWLLPFKSLEPVVRVLMFGAKKYAPDNWKNVEPYRERYFSACMRHLTAWFEGERKDPETGEHHLAHAICCLLFILWKEKSL
jgi:hypothetical protein